MLPRSWFLFQLNLVVRDIEKTRARGAGVGNKKRATQPQGAGKAGFTSPSAG